MADNKPRSVLLAVTTTIVLVVTLLLLAFAPIIAFLCGGYLLSVVVSTALLAALSLIHPVFMSREWHANKIHIATIGLVASTVSVLLAQYLWFWPYVTAFISCLGVKLPKPVPLYKTSIIFVLFGCLVVTLHIIWRR